MPISPESQYIIDGGFELLHLTADIHSFVYSTGLDVDGIVDECQQTNEDLNQKIEQCYLNWRGHATAVEKTLISYDAILGSNLQLDELVGYVTNILVDAYSACQNKPVAVSRNLDLDIVGEADIVTVANIRKVLALPQLRNWDRQFTRQWRHFVDDQSNASFDELSKFDAARRQQRLNAHRALMSELPHQTNELTKADRKHAIKVMKRSSALFKKHIGDHNLKAFLSGDAFTIDGKEFNYRIRRAQHVDLLRQAAWPDTHHIPYSLELLDKENNFLTSLCVYFDKTPALDQVIAMVLHIKHDEEMRILEKTNTLSRSELFKENKAIQKIWPSQFNGSGRVGLWDLLNADAEETNRLNRTLKPEVKEIIVDFLAPPKKAVEFMFEPGINFDEFHMLPADVIEQRILPFLETINV